MTFNATGLRYDDVDVGDELPPVDIELTRSLIVATAIASRDYQDVHHDPGLAQMRGSKDIFMNILSTNGFVGRFVTDWAGPDAPPARQPWMRVKNFQAQDMGITEGMGPLHDRTKETLGSTDAVIVAVRKRLIDAARKVAKGGAPPGLDPANYALRPFSALLPRSETDWVAGVGDAIETRPETFRFSV